MSRQKGKRGEREIAALLRPIYGDGVKRTLLAQARDGEESHDLDGVPWGVEVKYHQRVNIQRAFAQCERACARSGKPPLVISKDNHRPILATMLLDDFLAILRQAGPRFVARSDPSPRQLDEEIGEGLAKIGPEMTLPAATLRMGLNSKVKS
jgi:hypothetical protein